MSTTSLLRSKTPGIIIAEIQMMSSTFKGIHFLLEGDNDARFWKLRLSKSHVTTVTCEGKPNLLGAAKLAKNRGLRSVAGVYDLDFDRLLGMTHCPTILVATDKNDLEVTLLVSGALDAFLHELADEALVENFKTQTGISVATHIERVSSEFGRLRFLNHCLDHHVDFKKLSPYQFVSDIDWSLDLIGLQAKYAELSSTDVNELSKLLVEHCPPRVNWAYSQGHDCLRVLAQGMRQRISRRQISEEDIARTLRLAYALEMLQLSAMYKSLRVIEQALQAQFFP
jgi:hypothetical protein